MNIKEICHFVVAYLMDISGKFFRYLSALNIFWELGSQKLMYNMMDVRKGNWV